jgi:hypothetical protein
MTVYGGDVIYASDINRQIGTRVYKTSNTTRNSTASTSADPELVAVLPTAGRYRVDFYIKYAATSNGGFRTDWTSTGTFNTSLTANKQVHGINSGSLDGSATSSATSMRHGVHGFGTDITYGHRDSVNQVWCHEWALCDVTTAATITFQWSQETSHADDTTVYTGSYVEVREIVD